MRISSKLAYTLTAILILVTFVAWNTAPFITIEKLPFLDPTSGQLPRVLVLHESVTEYNNFFPTWNPYLMGGEPFTDASSQGIISIMWGLILLFGVSGGLSVSYPIAVILSAIAMFFLARYLFKNDAVSVLVAITYSSSGYAITMLQSQSLHQLYGFAFNPLIILFTIKAFREKQWMLYSVIAGVMLGLQMLISVDLKITLFLTLAMAALFISQLIRLDFKKHIKKTAIIGIIICLVGGGLAAQHLLTTAQTIGSGARGQQTYEESSRRSVSIGSFFEIGIQQLGYGFNVRYPTVGPGRINAPEPRAGHFALGIIATALAAIGIYFNRSNRIVIFLFLTLIVAILVITASPFYYFLWRFIPPWDSFRYLERGFSIWSLGISLLMGFGIISLQKLGKRKSISPHVVVGVIAILLIFNVFIFNRAPQPEFLCPIDVMLATNPVINYIKEQPGQFRVHEWETRGVDWPTDPYTTSARLRHLYGYTGNWNIQYMNEFLAIGLQSPAKFWGVMNVKYITSMTPINVSGLTLEKQVEPLQWDGMCPPQPVLRAYGPYIYRNDFFVPRAYVANHAILVAGNEDSVRQTTYALMLNPAFDPRTTVIIMATELPIEKNDLTGIDAIVFASSEAIGPSSSSALSAFKSGGGILIPDITIQQTQVSNKDVERILNSSKTPTPIDDTAWKTNNFEHYEITLPGSDGILIVSERFFAYPGWEAKVDGSQIKLERANGFVTATRINSKISKITFLYEAPHHLTGTIISSLTFILLIFYFSYEFIKHKKFKQKA